MTALEHVPGKVVGVHLSYRSRAAERGTMPAWPSYFLKPSSTIAGSGDPVARPAGLRTARLRGRGGAGHRPPRPPGQPCGRLGARGLDHRRERFRRARPAVRRPRRQRAVQGGRRLHPARPAADRRARRRPGHGPAAHLGQRGTGPGRLDGQGHAVRLRRDRRRPVPADHPGAGRRHPDRHARRLDRGQPRRRGGGRGHRGGEPWEQSSGGTAQPHRRGGLPPRPARRHAPGRRRGARGRLRPARRSAGKGPGSSSPGCARCPPPRWPRCCASAA